MTDQDWLDSYVQEIQSYKLGRLVEALFVLMLDQRMADSEESLTDAGMRSLKIETLVNEISNRETGKKDLNPSPLKKVTSLKGLF